MFAKPLPSTLGVHRCSAVATGIRPTVQLLRARVTTYSLYQREIAIGVGVRDNLEVALAQLSLDPGWDAGLQIEERALAIEARSRDGFHGRQFVVEHVQRDLRHTGDDASAARRAERQHGLVALEDDGRAHA